MKLRAGKVLLAALFLIIILSSCATMSAEDFYALPQPMDSYIQLQQEIDALLLQGAEYSSPTAGVNRQAVQFEDIDGDGTKEAIAFLSFAGSDSPLKVCVFRQGEEGYSEVLRIEGEGSSIESVNFTDMDGDGVKEIAVGWQIASGMNILSVYSVRNYQPSMIMSTHYTEYISYDLDDDGRGNILVLRLTGYDMNGEAELYTMTEDGEMVNTTAVLSYGCESLRRIRTGRLTDGYPSVLVECTINGSGIITDIFATRGGKLVNITLDEGTGQSDTVRTTTVYCRDINSDDVFDVPRLVQLPSLSDQTSYYLIDWYNYGVTGREYMVCTTYTNYSDYWSLDIPQQWRDVITVRRQDTASGERAIVFSYIGDGINSAVDFLTVYTFTGDNREERSGYGDRFVLGQDENTVYAGEILTEDIPLEVTEEFVKTNFRVLYTEWQSGEI